MKNFLISFKDGFFDLGTVLADGRAKILLRPIIIMLIACGGVYYLNGKINIEKNDVQKKISVARTQKSKIAGYQTLKEELIKLEQDFPDIKFKTEWLFGLVIDIFRDQGIAYDFGGSQKEESNDLFTVTTLTVKFATTYAKLGSLVAAIENSGKFVRISDLKFTKNESNLGMINVEMSLSTAFLKEQSFPNALVK